MQYSPEVERWRAKVIQYFGKAQADKWLHVINGESSGDPFAVGDGGSSHGLFQSQHLGGATADVDKQFQDAKQLYLNDLANGGTGFGDWGEGRLYKGQPFGSLGNHPYGGQALNARGPLDTGDVSQKDPIQATLDAAREYINQNRIAKGMLPADFSKPTTNNYRLSFPGLDSATNQKGIYKLSFSGLDAALGKKSVAAKTPSPASHLLPANIRNADIETQTQYLLGQYLDLLDQMGTNNLDELQAAADAGDKEAQDALFALPDNQKVILNQFNAVGKALNSLMQLKSAGLVTSGFDAAKAFVETEQGKQKNASDAFSDWHNRVNDLVSLGTTQHNIYAAATKNYLDAADYNSQLPNRIVQGEAAPLTPSVLINIGKPQYDFAPYMDALKSSTPATPPSFYNIPDSVYTNWYDQVNKNRRLPTPTSTTNPLTLGQTLAPEPASMFGGQ